MLVLLMGCVVLAGCAARPDVGALKVSDQPAAGATEHTILIATTRARADAPDTYFSGERGKRRDFARATISVPPAHKPGRVEWPSVLPGDPSRHFVAREAGYLDDGDSFRRAVNAALADRPAHERDVFVFIHGYNTLFAEGLYRFAQVVHDSGFTGVPVLFTWASRGNVTDYVYDLNSATVARDALEHTLAELMRSDARRIHIMAHSMGTWLLMETARQIPSGDLTRSADRIGQVVLAAPDIDIDVFKAQMRRIGKPPRPYMILLSKDDRALSLSSRIAGGKARVGGYENDRELAELGAVVVDLTDLDGPDATNHTKFTAIGAIAPQLQSVLAAQGLDPGEAQPATGLADAGRDLGSFVRSTAQIAVTLPVTLLTIPVALAGAAE
ncbi:hypothetical protein SL003B_2829 [Polymorphum gilvum SL003B-26A1]|uniref:Lipoprotein n=1 Tax=Polymorphum gilvum (strain LMG 25793 / CGMCC 1.9160 / SL003B-26A1) TaxID=991905 RepID=F2J5Z8_POLGS|nr:hypothetical protein SL003B_2829 [Polymorphum gilvum SL003B-26A1]